MYLSLKHNVRPLAFAAILLWGTASAGSIDQELVDLGRPFGVRAGSGSVSFVAAYDFGVSNLVVGIGVGRHASSVVVDNHTKALIESDVLSLPMAPGTVGSLNHGLRPVVFNHSLRIKADAFVRIANALGTITPMSLLKLTADSGGAGRVIVMGRPPSPAANTGNPWLEGPSVVPPVAQYIAIVPKGYQPGNVSSIDLIAIHGNSSDPEFDSIVTKVLDLDHRLRMATPAIRVSAAVFGERAIIVRADDQSAFVQPRTPWDAIPLRGQAVLGFYRHELWQDRIHGESLPPGKNQNLDEPVPTELVMRLLAFDPSPPSVSVPAQAPATFSDPFLWLLEVP